MKSVIISLISLFAGLHSFAQIVSIPDPIFKAELLANPLVNTNADAEIQVSEASAFAGALTINYNSISDLTGIEAFVNLTGLSCIGNQLTTLDLSSNLALTSLHCSANQLSTLNISANTALLTLACGENQLTSLDVSANTSLKYLVCNLNQLSSLDVSSNTALQHLNCMQNQIPSLNLSNHAALKFLYCNDNKLHTINLSGANALTYLQCGNNDDYSYLNLSGLSALATMNCINSPSLQCIQVSNVAAAYANSNWTKDANAIYSVNCATSVSNTETVMFGLYPNPASTTLNITGVQSGDQIQLYNIYGQLLLSDVCVNDGPKNLEIQDFSDGLYTMRVNRNKTQYIKKFVKGSFE